MVDALDLRALERLQLGGDGAREKSVKGHDVLLSSSNAAKAGVLPEKLDPQRREARAQPFGQRRQHDRLGA